jgi:hypothetical protein
MCLTGVDYFSTLGYQPSIAFDATGLLAPLATVVLIAVTLFGALPVYAHVARASPHGHGSISMLERLLPGWTGKLIVLVLLGFAATDFVITKTLSAADAAKHLIENPYWRQAAAALPFYQGVTQREQLIVTIVLLVLLGSMFLRGFREVIGVAVVIVGLYLFLNLLVIGSGLSYLAQHPDLVNNWLADVQRGPEAWRLERTPFGLAGSSWGTIALVCLLLFPSLALGLSGFETGVVVMPLVRGAPDDDPAQPRGRIRNTRKLLLTAAVTMSSLLLGSALVTSTLIPPEDLLGPRDPETGAHLRRHATEGPLPPAKDRALAYLAHGEGGTARISPLFGNAFGTLYDISTIAILWFAGASAMAGLLNLVPQYLPRYGMAPEWARAIKPLVFLFTLLNLIVTWLFKADVTTQGGAYATGVLVLISSAGVATFIDYSRWSATSFLAGIGKLFALIAYGLIALVFLYTTVDIIVTKPDGIKIASFFIAAIVVSSVVSRALRSTELRFTGFEFADAQSKFLWDSMRHLEFQVLVPHRPGRRPLADKEDSIRKEHRLAPDIPVVFIEVKLGDPSEFYHTPVMEVKQQEGRFILRVTRAASIAHVIAALSLELSKVGRPPEIHFGWSDESPVVANLGFLLLGEGNVPWMVRELILKAEPNPEKHPRIVIG